MVFLIINLSIKHCFKFCNIFSNIYVNVFYVGYKAICIHVTLILLFSDILVSRNCTQTHGLLFYLFSVLVGLNTLVYSRLFAVFLFKLVINFLKKNVGMMLNKFVLLRLLNAWYLYNFIHFPVFQKLHLHLN